MVKMEEKDVCEEDMIRERCLLLPGLPNKSRDVYITSPLLLISCMMSLTGDLWSLSLYFDILFGAGR